MNTNSHETLILAVILMIAMVVVGMVIYPKIESAFEKAVKGPVPSLALRR